MTRRLSAALALLVLTSAPATGDSLEGILSPNESLQIMKEATERQSFRLGGVQFVQVTRTMNATAGAVREWTENYEVFADPDGQFALRPVPDDEMARRYMEANGWTREEFAKALRAGAVGSLMVGAALEEEMAANSPFPTTQSDMFTHISDGENMCERAPELGRRVRSGDADSRKAYFYYTNPMVMMTENACFLKAAANVFDQYDQDPSEENRRNKEKIVEVLDKLEYQGQQEVLGRSAHVIALNDMDYREVMDDGQTITMHTMKRWIDTEHYGDVKMRMEGTIEGTAMGSTPGDEAVPMAAAGSFRNVGFAGDGSLRVAQRGGRGPQIRDFYLERELADYRTVAGSKYLHPYREVVRMGGILGPEEQAQLKEAQKQMAEFEKQLAEMPPSQRQMMENMMGPQLEQMRTLANQGTFETEIITVSVVINPDLKIAAARYAPAVEEDPLLARIQRDLVTLGYEPGNTHGELSRETIAAIISFQRDNKLELTGQPSPQLAGILAAKVKQAN